MNSFILMYTSVYRLLVLITFLCLGVIPNYLFAQDIPMPTFPIEIDELPEDTVHQVAIDNQFFNSFQSFSVQSNSVSEGIVPDSLEYQALVDFYYAMNGDEWLNKSNWLNGTTSQDFSNWRGITVTNGDITRISLPQNGLNGIIPESLGELKELRTLHLYNNQGVSRPNNITGSLPQRIGELIELRDVAIYRNHLTGELPSSIGNCTKIWRMYLYSNQIEGVIPFEIGNISELTEFYITDNELAGSIPDTFQNLTKLRALSLGGNKLVGSIPASIWDLTELNTLNLSDNNLQGTISDSIGNLSKLTHLSLYRNNFQGSIPTQLQELNQLDVLYIHNNNFSGPIPEFLGNLQNLTWLGLFDNNFTGKIPESFHNLTKMQVFAINRNNLVDSIPEWLSSFNDLWYLGLSGNEIYGTLPENFQNLTKLEWIDIQNTKISGSLPGWLNSFPKLYLLNAYNTEISSLTNLKAHPNIVNLTANIYNNKLDFTQLEKLFDAPSQHPFERLEYAPQKSIFKDYIITAKAGDTVQLTIPFQGQNTQYQWQKFVNNEWIDIVGAIDSLYTIDNLSIQYKGQYRCMAINDWVSDIILYTGIITLEILPPDLRFDELVQFHLLSNINESLTLGDSLNITIEEEIIKSPDYDYLRVSTVNGSFSTLLISHNPNDLWNSVIDLTQGGENTELAITLRNFGGYVDWSKLGVQILYEHEIWYHTYIPQGTNTREWFTINIPLSDFPNADLTSVFNIGFLRNFDPGAYDIGISKILVTGSGNPAKDIIFFDRTNTNNARENHIDFNIEVSPYSYLDDIQCTELLYQNEEGHITTLTCQPGYINSFKFLPDIGNLLVFTRFKLNTNEFAFSDTLQLNWEFPLPEIPLPPTLPDLLLFTLSSNTGMGFNPEDSIRIFVHETIIDDANYNYLRVNTTSDANWHTMSISHNSQDLWNPKIDITRGGQNTEFVVTLRDFNGNANW
jgi:Leucine-rich repeat (LRR) protein